MVQAGTTPGSRPGDASPRLAGSNEASLSGFSETPAAGVFAHMKQNTLLIISLALSIAGIVALLLITPDVSPQSLKLTGVVKKVSQSGGVSFIRFVPNDLEVVSFDGQDIGQGKAVFAGHLQEYKGKVEFVVDRVLPLESGEEVGV